MQFNHDEFEDIRDGVRAVCADFPDEYHRKIDRNRSYPEDFVDALTKAGWMAALIPEQYGGQAESGLCAVNGTEQGPARVGISVCDIAAGMNAFQSIVLALFARSQNGMGRIIDVSLYHALADWMNVPYMQTRYGHTPPQRVGLQHPTIAPYGAFECADGKAILISIQNEREWKRFAHKVLNSADAANDTKFASNNSRVANREKLEKIIKRVFVSAPRDAIIKRLNDAEIAFGRLTDLNDLTSHPQNRFIEVHAEAGTFQLMAPGFKVRGVTERYGSVPKLGEHTDALRAEFGDLNTE